MSKTSLKTIYEAVEMRNREAFAIHHQGEGSPTEREAERKRKEIRRQMSGRS